MPREEEEEADREAEDLEREPRLKSLRDQAEHTEGVRMHHSAQQQQQELYILIRP